MNIEEPIRCYIYEIKNNINNKTYIGQRKCKKGRIPTHDNYMGSGKHLKNAQAKYGIQNFTKTILVDYITDKKTLDDLEIKYISEYRKKGKAEYNLTDGGGGCLGIKRSKEYTTNISERQKGRKLSEITKLKISKAHKGKKLSESHIENMRNRTIKKPVYCLELDIVFSSIKEALRVFNKSGIRECCNGKRSSVYGYHFRYATETDLLIKPTYNKNLSLELKLDNKFKPTNKRVLNIEENVMFDSITQLASILNISRSPITRACNTGKDLQGYHFKYISNQDYLSNKYEHYNSSIHKFNIGSFEIKKAVLCTTNNTIYSSIEECSKTLGVVGTTISSVCRNKRKQSKGFHFRYATKEDLDNFNY